MGGAQPLSVTLNGGACLIVDVAAAWNAGLEYSGGLNATGSYTNGKGN